MDAPYAVGGCARDQSTTQYCGEAVAAHRRIAELEALAIELVECLAGNESAEYEPDKSLIERARKIIASPSA
jgi:hypothetical protein